MIISHINENEVPSILKDQTTTVNPGKLPTILYTAESNIDQIDPCINLNIKNHLGPRWFLIPFRLTIRQESYFSYSQTWQFLADINIVLAP